MADPVTVWESLRERGRDLIASEEDRRKRKREQNRAAQANHESRSHEMAADFVQKLLGADIAAALGPWRGSDPAYACIGQRTEPSASLPGDGPGEHGDLKFYRRGYEKGQPEVWYRPPMTDASVRVRDRDHLAQMIAQHSIYAGTP